MIPALVSTIIPVHDRPARLREAVGSVTAQSWRPLEVIIEAMACGVDARCHGIVDDVATIGIEP